MRWTCAGIFSCPSQSSDTFTHSYFNTALWLISAFWGLCKPPRIIAFKKSKRSLVSLGTQCRLLRFLQLSQRCLFTDGLFSVMIQRRASGGLRVPGSREHETRLGVWTYELAHDRAHYFFPFFIPLSSGTILTSEMGVSSIIFTWRHKVPLNGGYGERSGTWPVSNWLEAEDGGRNASCSKVLLVPK